MPKYGASREMSQSARPCAVAGRPAIRSALFATSGCSRAVLRPAAQELDACGVREPEEEVLGLRSTGVAPVSVEYGFLRSVGAYTELQFSQASPYWSLAPHFGHSPLM